MGNNTFLLKECTICRELKNLEGFYKAAGGKCGVGSWCIECSKKHSKTYCEVNAEKRNNKSKEWYKNNIDKVRQYYNENSEKFKNRALKYYKESPEIFKKRNHKRYINNKVEMDLINKKWKQDNPEKAKLIISRWRENNPEKHKLIKLKTYKNYRANIRNCISVAISGGIRQALKKNKNGYHWENLVGYSLNNLMAHLEKQFTDRMDWTNYGLNGWEIDHIIPVSLWKFESYNDREFKQCWALANLQPLWLSDNRSKSNKIYPF